MTGLVLQHGEWGPPGVLGDWAAERGVALEVHRTDLEPAMPALNGHAFVASLGSPHNPTDTHVPEIPAELELLERGGATVRCPCWASASAARCWPRCWGARSSTRPNRSWAGSRSRPTRPSSCPAGPWLTWHFDRFTLPPGARELARSPVAIQAFERGPHLGTQFHPESTVDIVRGWANADRNQKRTGGVDGDALLDAGAHHADGAVRAAYKLFDAFWQRASTGGGASG